MRVRTRELLALLNHFEFSLESLARQRDVLWSSPPTAEKAEQLASNAQNSASAEHSIARIRRALETEAAVGSS